eukprot:1419087-Rhodomonas_salina.2
MSTRGTRVPGEHRVPGYPSTSESAVAASNFGRLGHQLNTDSGWDFYPPLQYTIYCSRVPGYPCTSHSVIPEIQNETLVLAPILWRTQCTHDVRLTSFTHAP